jgi:hypothetical protein
MISQSQLESNNAQNSQAAMAEGPCCHVKCQDVCSIFFANFLIDLAFTSASAAAKPWSQSWQRILKTT